MRINIDNEEERKAAYEAWDNVDVFSSNKNGIVEYTRKAVEPTTVTQTDSEWKKKRRTLVEEWGQMFLIFNLFLKIKWCTILCKKVELESISLKSVYPTYILHANNPCNLNMTVRTKFIFKSSWKKIDLSLIIHSKR